MAMDSLQLLAQCCQKGLLSKEAAAEVLRVREGLIKRARQEKAAGLISAMRGAGTGAKGGLGKYLSALKGEGAEQATTWPNVAARLTKLIALGGIAATAGAGGAGLMRHSKDKKLRKEIEGSYKQMFKEYPKLDDLDRQKVQRHFGVLARYAPSMAADPMVAGSWVQSNAIMGHVDAAAIKQLADTQAQIDRVQENRSLFKGDAFRTGAGLAGKALMMSGGS